MSVTFCITVDSYGRPLLRCACEILRDEEARDFDDRTCAACNASLNMNNRNAADLIAWLGIEGSLTLCMHGSIGAGELAAKCRRRLWPEEFNNDPALPPVVKSERAIECGREANYLRTRTRDLLVIAVMAGDHFVSWS